MSYGLLNECLRIVGSIERVSIIGVNHELREAVMMTVLPKRDTDGQVIEKLNLFTLPVSQEDVHAVLEWVGAHVISFFMKQIKSVVRVHQPHQEELTKIMTDSMSSSSGSEA